MDDSLPAILAALHIQARRTPDGRRLVLALDRLLVEEAIARGDAGDAADRHPLVATLIAAARGDLSPTAAAAQLQPADLSPATPPPGALLAFGSASVGDVTVGDVAGRDIVHIHVHIPA